MSSANKLGERLKNHLEPLLKQHGMTQQQFADYVGRRQSSISMAANNVSSLTPDLIVAAVDLFGCSPNDLLEVLPP